MLRLSRLITWQNQRCWCFRGVVPWRGYLWHRGGNGGGVAGQLGGGKSGGDGRCTSCLRRPSTLGGCLGAGYGGSSGRRLSAWGANEAASASPWSISSSTRRGPITLNTCQLATLDEIGLPLRWHVALGSQSGPKGGSQRGVHDVPW